MHVRNKLLELDESLFVNHEKMLGFVVSGREEFNLGPEMRLHHSELLCNIVSLKYSMDREGFRHRHQKGEKRVLLASVRNGVIYSPISYYNESKEYLQVLKTSLDLLP